MSESTYLPEVECTVGPGVVARQLLVGVPDEDNRYHYLLVGKGRSASRTANSTWA
jgi:hypothetical protein